MSRIRITVVRKLKTEEIFGDNLPVKTSLPSECEKLEVGQEFISEKGECPQGFCSWAFSDIQRDITHLRLGGDFYWINTRGTMLSSCTDGLRPVIFKLERLED